jgi:hypothetical protein
MVRLQRIPLRLLTPLARPVGVLAGAAGTAALTYAAMMTATWAESLRLFRYLMILVIGFKLTVSYLVLDGERHDFELYRYYAARVRNGALVAMGAAFIGRDWILHLLGEHNTLEAVVFMVLS